MPQTKGEQVARKIEVASKATFTTDDKRAQYARLVVFNYGVKEKLIPKGKDVNTASNTELSKAADSLAGGNLLEGPDGIAYIQKMSEKGSTTGRALTVAYAQEVRPFIRRKTLSGEFGRRKGEPKAKAPAATKKTAPAKRSGAKRSTAKRSTAKRSTAKRSTAKRPAKTPVEIIEESDGE
jgi:hypothetical protein